MAAVWGAPDDLDRAPIEPSGPLPNPEIHQNLVLLSHFAPSREYWFWSGACWPWAVLVGSFAYFLWGTVRIRGLWLRAVRLLERCAQERVSRFDQSKSNPTGGTILRFDGIY